MKGPTDKPPCSAALEDELAALQLLLEDARRIWRQDDPANAARTSGGAPNNHPETSPEGDD